MRPRPPSIRAHLIALGLTLTLPVLVFSGLVTQRYVTSERERLHHDVREVARGIARSIDREIGHWEAIVDLLAHSPSLQSGELAAFHAQATDATTGPGINVVLRDRHGQQILNTLRPWGEPLPRTEDPDTDAKVFATKRTQVSDVFFGAVSGKPVITITAPVFRDGDVSQTLTIGLPTSVIAAVLNGERLPDGWTSGLVDRKNTVIARTPDHEAFAGRSASAGFVEHAVDEEGSWSGTNLTGTRSLGAYSRAARTGWIAGTSVPETVVLAPLYRSLAFMGAFGIVLLALALALAILVGRRIAHPMLRLADAAGALGEGRDTPQLILPVREVQAVGDALTRAAAVIEARGRALRRSEQQYKSLAESLPALAWIARRDGSTTLQNRRVRDYTGISFLADEDAWTTIVHPGDVARAMKVRRTAFDRNEAFQLEVRIRRRDGAYRWHQVRGVPIRGGEGGIETSWLSAAIDVEDLKQAQELQRQLTVMLEQRVAEAKQELRDEAAVRRMTEDQLRQTQKMDAIGRLAGGIAHDLDNKLVVIGANLDAVVKQTRNQPHVTPKLLAALLAAERAGDMITKLLAFLPAQDLRPKYLDVADHLGSILALLERSLVTNAVALEASFPADLWTLHVDALQLETAMVNLAVNARDAMPHGGTIAIEASNVRLAAGELPDADLSGDFVRIVVRDTGTGIAPDHLGRVFEPFFTTKERGKGSGLGLAQVDGFVRPLGGTAVIDSAVGKGTTVSMYLPKAALPHHLARKPAAADARDDEADGPPPRAQVLLVENDRDVAAALRAMIEELGYPVRVALGAEEALAIVMAEPPGIVLTDAIMPGSMNGVALGREIRRHYPVLPVILMAGNLGAVDEPNGFPVVAKSIASHRLDRAIRQQLGPGDPAKVVRLTGGGARRSR